MRNFFRWLLGHPLIDNSQPIQHQQIRKPNPSPMDEGDYHSGPYGYSPSTAYPETQCGSGFDEEKVSERNQITDSAILNL